MVCLRTARCFESLNQSDSSRSLYERKGRDTMVEVAPAPAKAAKKKRVNKPRTGPGLSDLIVTIVSASNERGGVSGSAIKRALTARGYDVEKNNGRVKLTLRNLVLKGTLIQAKGTGVSGSFKVSKKAAEPKAKKGNKTVKATTPATPTKKPAAKKSPKKAKKPAAKKTTKTPKKVKTPKKAAKKTSAVKRKPAKRVSKPKTKKAAPKKK